MKFTISSALFTFAAVAAAQSTTVTYECAEDSASDCSAVTSVISATSATAAATTYACNPAHSYPNGAECVSTNGALALITPSASSTGYTNGTATASAVYVTEVVTALTTYCPAATEITTNGKVYTVSSATTLTITDCPCTITTASTMSVATGSSSVTSSASKNGTASATTSTPVAYTGAAAHFGAGSGFAAVLAGAAILL